VRKRNLISKPSLPLSVRICLALSVSVANYSADRGDVNGEANIRSYGWCSDWPSGSTWIPPLLQSTDLDEVGFGTNESAFNEPEIDQKINEVFEMPAEEQAAAWQALEEEIMEKYLPVIPRYYGGVAHAHGSKIQGHVIDNTLGMPVFKNLWVSQG
jgi:peptide/nickel transport system substrate-binding protein